MIGTWFRGSAPKHIAEVEPDIERLDKLFTYYDHFEVEKQYEISFKEFVRKVDAGTWEAYLPI